MKKIVSIFVFISVLIVGALFVLHYVQNILPNKLLAAREVCEEESQGAIVIQEGRSKMINDISVSFDFLPVTGKLTFTVAGEKVFVSDEDVLTIGDKMYQIHGWGIGSDAWVALVHQE